MARWKSDGKGGSYYDPNDDGPDQVAPPVGATPGQGQPGQGQPGQSQPGQGQPPNPWHGGFTGRGQKPGWWDEWRKPQEDPGPIIGFPGGKGGPFESHQGNTMDPGMSPNQDVWQQLLGQLGQQGGSGLLQTLMQKQLGSASATAQPGVGGAMGSAMKGFF